MSDGVIVGIDGGGSKTLVATADRSGMVQALARGMATSPLEAAGWATALAAQVEAVARDPALSAVAAALPAYGEVEHVSAEQREVIARLFGRVPQRVLNDVDAAHLGAFAGGAGILILAGTGSMAWARDTAGTSHRTGGWGEVIGDEGSGYWIGRRVLRAVSHSLDGRAGKTGLVDAAFAFLKLDATQAVSELEGWASSLDNHRSGIASLAPLATRLAEAGDATAVEIIDAAADELALHIHTLEQRLNAPDLAWSYAGGMFSSPALLAALTRRIGRDPQAPSLPPVGGALLAAAQHLGWQTDEAWVARLAASLSSVPTRTNEAISSQTTGRNSP